MRNLNTPAAATGPAPTQYTYTAHSGEQLTVLPGPDTGVPFVTLIGSEPTSVALEVRHSDIEALAAGLRQAAGQVDPAMTLMGAVLDAIDLPLPGLGDADERAHRRLLRARVGSAIAALSASVDQGLAVDPAYLREMTDRYPVTYAVWTPDPAEDGTEGHCTQCTRVHTPDACPYRTAPEGAAEVIL
jgi:hypothetical protein